MITSFEEAHREFFKQFISDFSAPIITIPHKGGTLQVPFRMFKQSAKDRTEESGEQYPVLSVQPIQPKINKLAYNAYDPDRSADIDVEEGTVRVAEIPVPYTLKYLLSFASKDATQDLAYNTWFFKKFLAKNISPFIYNPINVPLNDNLDSIDIQGDYVSYSFEELEVTKETDGVFQTDHMFTVGPVWIALNDMVTGDLATVNVTVTPINK